MGREWLSIQSEAICIMAGRTGIVLEDQVMLLAGTAMDVVATHAGHSLFTEDHYVTNSFHHVPIRTA